MEEELISLKQVLRSLVVSSPTTMTVSSLLKDYRKMVGGALPLTKFGYRDPIAFLKERCEDVIVLEGPQWDPILIPRITENLKHLHQMVQRQRVQSASKYCQDISKQNSYKPRHEEYDTVYNTNNNDKEIINNNSVVENVSRSSLSKFYKKRLPQYNFQSLGADHVSNESPDSGLQSSSSQNSASKHVLLVQLRTEILALIQNSADAVWCTDLIRLYRQTYGREMNYNRFGYTSIISFVYSMGNRVTITRPTPAGDWLLQDPYRVHVQRVRGACVGLASCYLSTRELPTDPDEALPTDPDEALPTDSDEALPTDPDEALPTDSDEALPGVDFEPDVFPADCLHYMDTIPTQPLGELCTGAQFEVLVGEVYSPSHFWIIRVGDKYNMAMELIMDEMTEYYGGEGASRVLARGAIRVGQHCASVYERDWHRALIVSIIDSDTVKVRHVDYGTVETVSVSSLKPLRHEWGALAAQALRARLAGCRPPVRGLRWPRASCSWFLNRVCNKRLSAQLGTVDHEEDILETFLTDRFGAEDVCLTRNIIRMGHADKRNDSALKVSDERPIRKHVIRKQEPGNAQPKEAQVRSDSDVDVGSICENVDVRPIAESVRRAGDESCLLGLASRMPVFADDCYLYPRFEALESGDTPNYADISRILADDITLEYVDAYRRHVPGPWQSRLLPRSSLQSAELARPLSRPSLLPTEPACLSPRPSLLSAEQPRPLLRPSLLPAELTGSPLRPSLLSAEQARASTPLLVPPAPCAVSPAPDPPAPDPPTLSPSPPPPEHPTADELPQPLNRMVLLRIDERDPVAGALLPVSPARAPAPPELPPAERGLEVQLSEAEWDVLSHLRSTDPAAAHWYLLSMAWRVIVAPPNF